MAAVGRLRLGDFNQNAAAAARWTENTLTPEHREYLSQLPFQVAWHNALLVHASPAEPENWHYVLSIADAQEEMGAFIEPLCFIGHSHYPGVFDQQGPHVRYTRTPEVRIEKGHRYLVNVASVGQPRDGDWRAGYLLYDEAAGLLKHVRVEYDVQKAMQRIVEAGLPRFLADRLQWGE